jgi:glycosyltransferase involved in cell wall biosynthesis
VTEGALVSVVVPAFRAEGFIGEAIDSVLAQDYEPVELVVVDDGSPDRSAAIAESRGVRCARREKNGGQAAARNSGVAATSGHFVSFLDADDLWQPGKLSAEVAHLAARPELGYVVSMMQRTLMEGASWPPGTPREWFDQPQPGTLASAALIRRSALEEIGPFDESYRHGSDTDWQARAADAGVRYAVLPEVSVRYRIHGGNDSYDNLGMRDELFTVLRGSLARKRAERKT